MMSNVKFHGAKLREALRFRGIRMADLARATDISRQSLSLYANDENRPSVDNMLKIAQYLDFPMEFFLNDDSCTVATSNTYFRSQAAARKKSQEAEKLKMEYTAKLYETLLEYVNFPELSLPDTSDFKNLIPEPEKIDADSMVEIIEKLALRVRDEWHLGLEPIDNMQYLLASHGIIVVGFHNVDDKIDAFSQKINIKGHGVVYIIALAVGSKPMTRLRFDMAHELGHILMHHWDDTNETLSKQEFNNLERQANMFASAFLLPAKTFGNEVGSYAASLNYYRALKRRWKVSMQAMMYRAREMNIITGNQFSYLMRQISAKGERKHEQGDRPGKLEDSIFQGAIDVLLEGGYLTVKSLINAFHEKGIYLSKRDMENLMGLKPETLKEVPSIIKFKPKVPSK